MDIIVAIKQVPDVDGVPLGQERGAGIPINDQATDLARDRLGSVTNPFDEWALEEALLLKEVTETGVIVTQGFGGGGIGQLELALPAVLGIQVSLRDPRYVSDVRIRLASMGGGIEEVLLDATASGSGLTVRRVFTPEASRRA